MLVMFPNRVLKRVPLDFDWPLKQVWSGYVNPYHQECPACECGYTPARRWLQKVVHNLMWTSPGGWQGRMWNQPGEPPSSDMLDLTSGLAGRRPYNGTVGGHDTSDCWKAEEKIIKAAGLNPKRWGICTVCKGTGIDPAAQAKYRRWRRANPPNGPGYQLWETTSEGSPISPVFPTLDELCEWAAQHAYMVVDQKATTAEWKQWLTDTVGE